MLRNWPLVLTASLALALGVLVTLTDRPPAHVALLPAGLAPGSAALFGTIGQWLPSLVHPFAFSLLSATVRAPAAAPAYGVCAGWWTVNVVFEVAQHPRVSAPVVEVLHAAFGAGGPRSLLARYLLQGSFDVGDLLAATAGAIAAAAVLWLAHRRARHAA